KDYSKPVQATSLAVQASLSTAEDISRSADMQRMNDKISLSNPTLVESERKHGDVVNTIEDKNGLTQIKKDVERQLMNDATYKDNFKTVQATSLAVQASLSTAEDISRSADMQRMNDKISLSNPTLVESERKHGDVVNTIEDKNGLTQIKKDVERQLMNDATYKDNFKTVQATSLAVQASLSTAEDISRS